MREGRDVDGRPEVVRRCKDIGGGGPNGALVSSMVGRNYRLTKDRKNAAAALNLRLASTAMSLRQIYADAPGQGEIVRQLGRGGMGAVYLARERALERFVAIKVLRPDLADAQDARERFRREARIAAQLSHPGILPLHTFGEVAGLWCFAMAYVRGATLAHPLRPSFFSGGTLEACGPWFPNGATRRHFHRRWASDCPRQRLLAGYSCQAGARRRSIDPTRLRPWAYAPRC